MEKTTDIYKESMRYIDNAKEILSTKANKNGDYYSDAKYVRMASNTAYNGLLLSLDALFDYKGINVANKSKEDRASKKTYTGGLGQINKSMIQKYEAAYRHLHLYGGYDGELYFPTINNGIKVAVEIIDWVKQQITKK